MDLDLPSFAVEFGQFLGGIFFGFQRRRDDPGPMGAKPLESASLGRSPSIAACSSKSGSGKRSTGPADRACPAAWSFGGNLWRSGTDISSSVRFAWQTLQPSLITAATRPTAF